MGMELTYCTASPILQIIFAFPALHSNPLYVHNHSKQALMNAVYNDTQFLTDFNVIDYSLLVGLDTSTGDLVVGLVGMFELCPFSAKTRLSQCLTPGTMRKLFFLIFVDYIRTYTWDKKLESWVKETGILGGGGKEPTILSPKQYRSRFKEAMDRYFHVVAD